MKRLTALLLFSVMLLLAGCGSQTADPPKDTAASVFSGKPLSEYTIVYSDVEFDFNLHAAEYVRDGIAAATGVTLPLVLDTDSEEKDAEILIGDTNRTLSSENIGSAPKNKTDFTICTDVDRIILNGCEYLVGGAAYRFVSELPDSADKSVSLPDGGIISAPKFEKARNFILVIGDGMGFNSINLGEQLADTSVGEKISLSGYPTEFVGNRMPHKGESVTRSADSDITDSAAGGTALATGFKVNNGVVGIAPDGTVIKNLCELALELGMKAGITTTDSVTGATPADFSAHVKNRGMDNDILAQQENSGINVIIGSITEDDIYESIENTLATLSDGDKGFFLMHEEAYIDKGSHSNNQEKFYTAYSRLNIALRLFAEFMMYNPDTLLVLTADHETGGITFRDEEGNMCPGIIGKPGTAVPIGRYVYTVGDHTGVNVPLYGIGVGTEAFDGMIRDNTFVGKFFARQMSADNFGDPNQAEAYEVE